MHNCMTSVPERITARKSLKTRYVASCRLENANWPGRLNPETDEHKKLSFTIKIVDRRERLLSSSSEKYSLGKILVQRGKKKKKKGKSAEMKGAFFNPVFFKNVKFLWPVNVNFLEAAHRRGGRVELFRGVVRTLSLTI